MAIDASIPLSGRPLSIADAANQGLAFGQNMQQQIALTQKTQMDAQEQGQANEIKAARLMHDTSVQLKSLPIEQRAAVAQQALPVLAKLGVDTSKIDTSNLTDDVLDQSINALQPFTVNMDQRMASSRPIGNETIVDKNGTAYAQSRVFDPRTQKVSLIETALGPSSSITNRMGQTAQDQYTNALRLKQQQEAYAAQKALEVAGGKSAIELQQEINKTPIIAQQEAEKKATEQRAEYKKQAVAAAENIPTLERAIELNNKVVTGGSQAALQAAANYLGVASSDPGELRSLLNQNILGQLKSTFGGNPTEGERAALGQAQASFNQSGEVNQALLDNALKLARMRVNRGKQAANKDGDKETMKYIEDALSVKLGETPKQKAPPKSAPVSNDQLFKDADAIIGGN